MDDPLAGYTLITLQCAEKNPLMSFMNNSNSRFCPSPKFHDEPLGRIKNFFRGKLTFVRRNILSPPQ